MRLTRGDLIPMQIEELGLFSGGKCNKAVEDKIAFEVFDLYLILKKELNKCLYSKDVDALNINDESFDDLEDKLKKLEFTCLIPKLFAYSEVISQFGNRRDHRIYRHFTTLYYVVVLSNIIDYLKSIIFDCSTLESYVDNYFYRDDKFHSIDEMFKTLVNKKLEEILVK